MFESLETDVRRLHNQLRSNQSTLSVAESCTGGMIGAAVTSVPGSSDVFAGGAITYSNRMKHSVLGVEENTLETHGAVSEPVVREMASGATETFGTDYAVGVSGIAGPEGGSVEKPVGLVHFGFVSPNGSRHERQVFDGHRFDVRFSSVEFAIEVLCDLSKNGRAV